MSDTAAAAASDAGGSAARSEHAPRRGEEKRGLFARIALFVRQVVSELKKVVRPTRQELITYTSVVLVFVTVVMLFVTLIDLGIGQLAFWVFG